MLDRIRVRVGEDEERRARRRRSGCSGHLRRIRSVGHGPEGTRGEGRGRRPDVRGSPALTRPATGQITRITARPVAYAREASVRSGRGPGIGDRGGDRRARDGHHLCEPGGDRRSGVRHLDRPGPAAGSGRARRARAVHERQRHRRARLRPRDQFGDHVLRRLWGSTAASPVPDASSGVRVDGPGGARPVGDHHDVGPAAIPAREPSRRVAGPGADPVFRADPGRQLAWRGPRGTASVHPDQCNRGASLPAAAPWSRQACSGSRRPGRTAAAIVALLVALEGLRTALLAGFLVRHRWLARRGEAAATGAAEHRLTYRAAMALLGADVRRQRTPVPDVPVRPVDRRRLPRDRGGGRLCPCRLARPTRVDRAGSGRERPVSVCRDAGDVKLGEARVAGCALRAACQCGVRHRGLDRKRAARRDPVRSGVRGGPVG